MMFVSQLLLLSIFFVCSVLTQNDPYTVPNPVIEVFRPRGLRVSIPDYPEVRLFAFHGVVNRELNGLEAGDLSQDILKKTDNKWVFEDTKLKLNVGDVLNFWLFVIKGNLGYRLDEQTYTVTSFQEAPPGFLNNKYGPNRKTTTAAPYPIAPEFIVPQSPPCHCANQPLQPITIIPPICIQPVQQSTTEPPRAPTIPSVTPPEDLQVWRDLLVKLSNENAEYRDKLLILRENNKLLISKLERIGDENLNKLLLSGRVSTEGSAASQIELIFREKLGILDTQIIKSAARNSDGTIIFELKTIDDKLFVLRTANEKLKNSRIMIQDVDNVPSVIEPRIIFN